MKTKVSSRRLRTVLMCILASVAITGCSGTIDEGPSAPYVSLDQLAADSSAIAVGVVEGQWRRGAALISSVEVIRIATNPQLAANLDSSPDLVAVGQTIEVRHGSASLLEVGEEYLLYLVGSEGGDEYTVTGTNAGVYVREGNEFRRVASGGGNELPERITVATD